MVENAGSVIRTENINSPTPKMMESKDIAALVALLYSSHQQQQARHEQFMQVQMETTELLRAG